MDKQKQLKEAYEAVINSKEGNLYCKDGILVFFPKEIDSLITSRDHLKQLYKNPVENDWGFTVADFIQYHGKHKKELKKWWQIWKH